MIDVHRDRLLTLTDAASRIPGRGGKQITYKTAWKWARKGVRGVILETVLFGGHLVTSEEAITRFTSRTQTGAKPAPKAKNDAARIEAMRRKNSQDGIGPTPTKVAARG